MFKYTKVKTLELGSALVNQCDWGRVLESQGLAVRLNRVTLLCVLHSRSALPGVYQVFKHYTKMSSQPRTIALRDFYQGF